MVALGSFHQCVVSILWHDSISICHHPSEHSYAQCPHFNRKKKINIAKASHRLYDFFFPATTVKKITRFPHPHSVDGECLPLSYCVLPAGGAIPAQRTVIIASGYTHWQESHPKNPTCWWVWVCWTYPSWSMNQIGYMVWISGWSLLNWQRFQPSMTGLGLYSTVTSKEPITVLHGGFRWPYTYFFSYTVWMDTQRLDLIGYSCYSADNLLSSTFSFLKEEWQMGRWPQGCTYSEICPVHQQFSKIHIVYAQHSIADLILRI